MTGKEFAEWLGVHPAMWSGIKNGRRQARFAFIGHIAQTHPELLELQGEEVAA